jgi:hypothetical protein
VLLARPIHPSEPPVAHHPHSLHPTVVDSRREVPWRLLTDGALGATSCCRSTGTSTERREGAGLTRALCTGKPNWRSSDVRRPAKDDQ